MRGKLWVGLVFASVCSMTMDSRALDSDNFEILRGDANNDGAVDMSDVVFIETYLFLGGADPVCMDMADVNDDGFVDLTDVISLQSYLFSGGAPPASPFPYCGQDTTADYLAACSEDPECQGPPPPSGP